MEASPTLDIDQTKLNDISEYSDGQLRSPRGAQTPASPHTRLPPVLPNRQVCARAPCRFGSTAARLLRGSLSLLGVFAARGGCFRRPALLDASVVVSRSKSLYLPLPHPERSAWRRSEGPLLILPILCESERENPPRHDAACGPSAKPTATAPCRRQRGAAPQAGAARGLRGPAGFWRGAPRSTDAIQHAALVVDSWSERDGCCALRYTTPSS